MEAGDLAEAAPGEATAAGVQAAEECYWRERCAAAARAGQYGLSDVQECDRHLARIAEAARAARPWAARAQAATQAHDRACARLEGAAADLEAARAAVLALEKVHAAAHKAEQEAARQLQQVKAEAAADSSGAATTGTATLEEAIALLRQLANQAGVGLDALAARLQEEPFVAAAPLAITLARPV